MRKAVGVVFFGTLMMATTAAQAGGLGRLFTGLVARGAIAAATGAARSKAYTSDVLTVTQLVACLQRANALDKESEQLDIRRSELDGLSKQIEDLQARIAMKRATLDRSSQIQVDSVNGDIGMLNANIDRIGARGAEHNQLVRSYNEKENAYNADCAKKYYADDMVEARKLAGL